MMVRYKTKDNCDVGSQDEASSWERAMSSLQEAVFSSGICVKV